VLEGPCEQPGLEGFGFAFITNLAAGSTVTSPFTVEGCANHFEAAVSWQLLDGRGAVLDENDGPVTASCGTGCVGTFSFDVDYTVSERSIAYLAVFDRSADDGSPQGVNSIPVLLLPAGDPISAPDDPCDNEGLDQFGFVFVTAPSIGESTSSPFDVSGCANVFEASVSWQLLTPRGDILEEGFTTATCGTGCAGDFSFSVDHPVTEPTIVLVAVFESSANDGSPQLVNSIPVMLTP